MRARRTIGMAIAALPLVVPAAPSRSASFEVTSSEVYIQQSRGRVAPGTSVHQTKPPPETTTLGAPAAAAPTAPVTCNAQNASSQACYTATQQSRPAGR